MKSQLKGRPGRPATTDALEVVAALHAGERYDQIAERLGIGLSSVYKARDRARRIVLDELFKDRRVRLCPLKA